MNDNRTTYIIRAEVRDANGKIVTNANGSKVTHLQMANVNIEPKDLNKELSNTFADLKALMPSHLITVEASVYNSIGGSYMSMARYDEQGYVKFT